MFNDVTSRVRMYLFAPLRTYLARHTPAARTHRQTCIRAPLQHERNEAPRQESRFLPYLSYENVDPGPRRFSTPRMAVAFSAACRPCLDQSLLSFRLYVYAYA